MFFTGFEYNFILMEGYKCNFVEAWRRTAQKWAFLALILRNLTSGLSEHRKSGLKLVKFTILAILDVFDIC